MQNLALCNDLFFDLKKDELLTIDGGNALWRALVLTAGCVVTALAPVAGIATGIGASVAFSPVIGVSAGVGAGCAVAAAGTNIIDYGVSMK